MHGVHGVSGAGRSRPPFSAEHVFANLAHAGLNPNLGNELQLQEKEGNYISGVPLEEPSGLLASSGTHLQPLLIAFNQTATYVPI